MKQFRVLILGLVSLFAQAAVAEMVAITDARVLTGDNSLEQVNILIEDGRIREIGPKVRVPNGAEVIDAEGRVVTAALMNPATQLGLTEVGSAATTNDQSAPEGAINAAFAVHFAVNANSVLIAQARADGLLRAAIFPSAGSGSPLAGTGALLHLGRDEKVVERQRAAVYADIGGAEEDSRAAQWVKLRAALDQAREFDEDADDQDSQEAYYHYLNMQALKPLFDGDLPLVIATHRESDIRNAVQLARDYDIRVVIQGGDEAWRVAGLLAANKIPVILDPLANMPMSFDKVGARADNARRLHESGVVVAFSVLSFGIHTTYNAGSTLREAAGLAVSNGLPYEEGLRAITLNPARIWGLEDRYGRVKPGYEADLVIWDGDPLEPTTAPFALLSGGKKLSLETRQTLLRDRYAPKQTKKAWSPD